MPDDNGPSWLTFIGHAKDSLWSIDLFRCESILLNTHWVLVVMDQFTRRIIGFGVHAGDVDGVALCRMFNTVISTRCAPKYLSSDNDPLFLYHQWQANLRVLSVDEIKAVPYMPISHPLIERLIGTNRREYLDHTLFWNTKDLERKLADFRQYYNRERVHQSLGGEHDIRLSDAVQNMLVGDCAVRRRHQLHQSTHAGCRGYSRLFRLEVSCASRQGGGQQDRNVSHDEVPLSFHCLVLIRIRLHWQRFSDCHPWYRQCRFAAAVVLRLKPRSLQTSPTSAYPPLRPNCPQP